MAIVTAGWTSRRYDWGLHSGATRLPTRAYFTCDFDVGPGEALRIRATFGKRVGGLFQYRTFLHVQADAAGNLTVLTDLRDQSVDITSNVPTALADWSTVVKVELIVDDTTPDKFGYTEPVILFLGVDPERGLRVMTPVDPARRVATVAPVITTEPVATTATIDRQVTRQERSLALAGPSTHPFEVANLRPAVGAQVQFRFAGTDMVAAIARADHRGLVSVMLPPGRYDVRCTTHGFTPDSWLEGTRSLLVGVSDTISKFGETTGDVVSRAEKNHMRAQLAAVQWAGFHLFETFEDARLQYRDETADPDDMFHAFAVQKFGRLFRANTSVEFFSLSTDPTPS